MSSVKTQFELRDGKPMLLRLSEIDFIDDKVGKPVGVSAHIGQLDKTLDEAQANGWIVVDMMRDWNAVYPTPGN